MHSIKNPLKDNTNNTLNIEKDKHRSKYTTPNKLLKKGAEDDIVNFELSPNGYASKRSNQPSVADKYSPFCDSDKKECPHVVERSYVMSKQYQNSRAKSISRGNLIETEWNKKLLKEQINEVKIGRASAMSQQTYKDSLQNMLNSPSDKENIPRQSKAVPYFKVKQIVPKNASQNSSTSKNDLFNSVLEEIEKTSCDKPQTAQPKIYHSNVFTQPILKPTTAELNIDEIEKQLSITERCTHTNWQIRRSAYKEIALAFKNYQPLEDSIQSSQNKDPFSAYSNLIGGLITDANITAQYEGFCTVYEYIANIPTIVNTTLAVVPLLFDKVPMSKVHFKEVLTKIVSKVITKGAAEYIMNEIFNRINRKQAKTSIYCMQLINDLLNTECCDKINLAKILKVTENAITTQKEVRDAGISIIKSIYSVTMDDVESFISNLSQIKPVVLQEIEKILKATQKKTGKPKRIFQEKKQSEYKKLIDTDCEESIIDLNEYMDEEMKKITYLTKADQKRRILATLKVKLEKTINDKTHVAKKDYSLLINIITNLIDDTDGIIQIEAIQILIILAQCMKSLIDRQKAKFIALKVIEKYKETKTTIIELVNHALNTLVKCECIPEIDLFDALTGKSQTHKNPKVRYSCLSFIQAKISNQLSSKANLRKTFEESIDLLFKSNDTVMFQPEFCIAHQKLIAKNFLSIFTNEQKANIKSIAINIISLTSLLTDNEDIYTTILSKMPPNKQKEIASKYTMFMSTASKAKERPNAAPSNMPQEEPIEECNEVEQSPVIEKYKAPESIDLRQSLSDRIAALCIPDNLSFVITISKMLINNSNVIDYISAADPEKLSNARLNVVQSLSMILSERNCYQPVPKLITLLYRSNNYSSLEDNECELHNLLIVIFILFAQIETNEYKKEVFELLSRISATLGFKCMVLGLHNILFKLKYKEVSVLTGNRMNCFIYVFEWIAEQLSITNTAYSKPSIENLLSILNGESFEEKYKKPFADIQSKILKLMDLPKVATIRDSLASASLEKWNIAEVRKVLQNKNILQIRRTLNSFITTVNEGKEGIASSIFGEQLQHEQVEGFIADLTKLYKTAKLKSKEISNICSCLIETFTSYSLIIVKCLISEFQLLLRPNQQNELHDIYEVLDDCCKSLQKRDLCIIVSQIMLSVKNANPYLFSWLETHVIGEEFDISEISELCTLVATKISEPANAFYIAFLKKAVTLHGENQIKIMFESALASHGKLFLVFIKWFEENYKAKRKDTINEECMPNTNKEQLVPQLILSPIEPLATSKHSDNKEKIESQVKNLNDIYQKEVQDAVNLKQKIEVKTSQRKSNNYLRPTPSPKKAEEITAFSPRFGSEELTKNNAPLNIKELSTDKKDPNLTLQKIGAENPPPVITPQPESNTANLEKFRYMFIQQTNSFAEIAYQMTEYYRAMSQTQREDMVDGICKSIENTNYLKAVSCDGYMNIMLICFTICIVEKVAHNDLTKISQQMQSTLNYLLNSRSCMFVLKCLIRLLKQIIPTSKVNLIDEQKVLLSYVCRCISKFIEIIKGSNAANIKPWVVLIEIYDMFALHSPEKLRDNEHDIEDYDAIMKMMKEITDICIPNSCIHELLGMLQQSKEYQENSYTKYLQSISN